MCENTVAHYVSLMAEICSSCKTKRAFYLPGIGEQQDRWYNTYVFSNMLYFFELAVAASLMIKIHLEAWATELLLLNDSKTEKEFCSENGLE